MYYLHIFGFDYANARNFVKNNTFGGLKLHIMAVENIVWQNNFKFRLLYKERRVWMRYLKQKMQIIQIENQKNNFYIPVVKY